MIIYQLNFLTCFSDKFMRIKKTLLLFQYGGQYKTHINAVKTKVESVLFGHSCRH